MAEFDIVGWWQQRRLTLERLRRVARSSKREPRVARGETIAVGQGEDGPVGCWPHGVAGVQVGSNNLQVNNYLYGSPSPTVYSSPQMPVTGGLGVVAERNAYEQMVQEMLSEAVRNLNRSEGARHLGGLSLTLQYQSESGIIFDAAVTSGHGEYVVIEVRHSYARVTLMEMSFTLRQAVTSAPKSEGFKYLFISNGEPISAIDVEYLNQVARPGKFDYVRVAGVNDFPKILWAIRGEFKIHG